MVSAARAQTLTQISDTLYNADGTKASGRIVISWDPFSTADSITIDGGTLSYTIPASGVNWGKVDVSLASNTGATPSGTSYRARYYLANGASYQETWVVPASGPVTISDIRASTTPTPGIAISAAQITGILPLDHGGTNASAWTSARCVRVNNAGTALESAASDCGSGGGAGHTFQEEGGALPQRTGLNFIGGAVTASDDAGNNRTNITVAIGDADIPASLARDGEINVQGTANEIVSSGSGIAPTLSLAGALDLSGKILQGAAPLVFEGSGADANDTTVAVTNPTADRTFTIPNADSVAVQPLTCSGTDKVSAISAAGVMTCAADQEGSPGGGIATLNTLAATTQTFTHPDDANVTLTISSATDNHQFQMGWTGSLAKTRQNAATAYRDEENLFTQAGGITADNQLGIRLRELTANGANYVEHRAVADVGAGNTTYTWPAATDSRFLFSGAGGALAWNQASGVGACGVNNFATAANNNAAPTCAQPAFSNLSGAAGDAQVPNDITIDQATLALTGDSATAFFSTGTLEDARLSSNVALYNNGSKTWGGGSGFNWTFDAGVTDRCWSSAAAT